MLGDLILMILDLLGDILPDQAIMWLMNLLG